MKSIYLYCLTSSKDQLKKRSFSTKDRVKQNIKILLWNSRRLIFKKYIWEPEIFVRYDNSNKGDIAIRISIEELLRSRLNISAVKELSWGTLSKEMINEINRNGYALIIGGSGYFICNAEGNLNAKIGDDLTLLSEVKVPIIYYSVGYNLNYYHPGIKDIVCSRETLEKISALTNNSMMTSVRDEKTYKLFKEVGVDPLFLVPDPVIFMERAESRISLNKEKLNVGLNLALHGGITGKFIENNFDIYLSVLRQLKENKNADIVYFKHEEYENLLIKELRKAGLISMLVDLPPKEMLHVYGQLDIHICQMMHSSIMSFNQAVPTVNFAYDIKNEAFFDLIQQSEYCLRLDEIKEKILFQRVEKLIDNRGKIKEQMKGRKAELWKMEERYLTAMEELFEKA